jgi:GTPase involved in cell partitioning and DNA repair
MKKIILLPLLVLGIAFAEDANQTKPVQTMQNLESAMATIQKGMMYNNQSIVAKGVEEIKLNTKDISSFDIKNKEGTNFKAKKYSMTQALAIEKLADNILVAFRKENRNRVLDTYRRMQNQCMTCHALVRKW